MFRQMLKSLQDPTRRECLHRLARTLLKGPWKQENVFTVAQRVELGVHRFSSTSSGYRERMITRVDVARKLAKGLSVCGDEADDMRELIEEVCGKVRRR